MASPTLADGGSEGPDVPSVADQDEEPTEPDTTEPDTSSESSEPEVAEVDLGDDDYGGGDLFDDVEDSGSSGSSRDESDGSDDPMDEIFGGESTGLAKQFNEGAARVGVAGLDDDEERDALQTEFSEIFDAFGLGHFAERTVEEYVLVGDEEIDPAWGLLGAVLVCAAVVLTMRPDGDEQMKRLSSAVGGLAGGSK